jgi:hypothetical protein
MSPFAVVLEVILPTASVCYLFTNNDSNLFSCFEVHYFQIFEVAPSLFMVDVRKVAGDTLEYHRVCSCITSCIVVDFWGIIVVGT